MGMELDALMQDAGIRVRILEDKESMKVQLVMAQSSSGANQKQRRAMLSSLRLGANTCGYCTCKQKLTMKH